MTDQAAWKLQAGPSQPVSASSKLKRHSKTCDFSSDLEGIWALNWEISSFFRGDKQFTGGEGKNLTTVLF